MAQCFASLEVLIQDGVCDSTETGRGGLGVCEQWRGTAGNKTWHLATPATQDSLLVVNQVVSSYSRDNGVAGAARMHNF